MIIFQVDFVRSQLSVIFSGSWGNSVNWLEPKTKPP